jgi:hypothetical protein
MSVPFFEFGTFLPKIKRFNKLNKLRYKQYRAWSDCTDALASLTLYWWQRLILTGKGELTLV